MTQRGFVIPLMLILYAVAALAVLGAVGVAKHKVEHWCNVACTDARHERDQLAAEKKEAMRREAAIATLYGAQVAATQAAESKRDEVRHDTFQPIRNRAASLGVGVRVPADAVRVLSDAASAANTAGTPAVPDQAPAATPPSADSSSDQLVAWFVDVAEIHAECRDRVAAWVTFYRGLQAAQSEVPIEQIH
jgi:hypothetical protein